MKYLHIGLLFGLLFSVCFAQLSDYLQQKDREEISKVISSSKQSFLGLKTTYYSVSTLKKLGGQIPSNVCADVAKVNTIDIEDLFYSAAINEALSCGNQINVEKINSALNADSLKDLYFGISTALALKAKKQIAEKDTLAGVENLLKLGEEDGTFKPNSRADDGSLFNGALALQVLSRVASELTLEENIKGKIVDVLKNAQDTFNTFGEEEHNTLFFADADSKATNLRVTSTLFSGFLSLASILKQKVDSPSKGQVTAITEYLISRKHVSNSEDAFFVLEGLNAASSNTVGVPIAVTLTQSSISPASKEGVLSIKTTNANGNDIPTKVFLIKAYPVGNEDKSLINNQEVVSESGVYKLNFIAAKPEPGFYNLEFRVTPSDKGAIPISSVSRKVKVLTTVSATDAHLIVSDSQDAQEIAEGRKFSVEFGKSAEGVTVDDFQHLYVNFKLKSQSGKSIQAQQVFVRISNEKREHFAVAKFTGKQYSAHISLEDVREDLLGLSGPHEIQIIVGDSFIQNPFSWKIASLVVKYSVKIEAPKSPFSVEPEIQHVFRKPESRPDPSISFAFTIAVLSPLAVFLLGLLRIGANFSNFPFSGISFIYALGFHASLGAILALYAFYWLQLNMMQTLGYLAILAVPFLFFSMKALNQIQIGSDKSKRD